MPHARVWLLLSRVAVNALGRLGSTQAAVTSRNSRLLLLQYRLVLCCSFWTPSSIIVFIFRLLFMCLLARSQKGFGGHGRSPLHSISDQVPFTWVRSTNTTPRTAIAVVLSVFVPARLCLAADCLECPGLVCPIQAHSNRVTDCCI